MLQPVLRLFHIHPFLPAPERVRDGWRVAEAKDIEVVKCGSKERMLMLLQ